MFAFSLVDLSDQKIRFGIYEPLFEPGKHRGDRLSEKIRHRFEDGQRGTVVPLFEDGLYVTYVIPRFLDFRGGEGFFEYFDVGPYSSRMHLARLFAKEERLARLAALEGNLCAFEDPPGFVSADGSCRKREADTEKEYNGSSTG